jgi:hypothetical protein
MSAQHRLAELPPQRLLPADSRARYRISLLTGAYRAYTVIAVSLIVAAGLAALMVSAIAPQRAPQTAIDDPAEMSAIGSSLLHAAHQVSQEGTVVAVSANSVTARSADGFTQTYLLTPDTTVITKTGYRAHSALPHFMVDDEVAILGTSQNGTVLATALAHRNSAHGAAPPMDFVGDPREGQPASGGSF